MAGTLIAQLAEHTSDFRIFVVWDNCVASDLYTHVLPDWQVQCIGTMSLKEEWF